MNILMLHLDPIRPTYNIGISYLASTLRKEGYSVYFIPVYSANRRYIKYIIREFNINIVLISLTSDSFTLCQDVIAIIQRARRLPIILGGIHPTVVPDDCIEIDGVFAICRGEGETVVTELLKAIQQGRDITQIENLWVRINGEVYKNPLRSIRRNIDELPLPDYTIFRDYFNFRKLPVLLSRGCPFKCPYCCNHLLQRIYGEKHYVRRHSVEYSIRYIKQALSAFPEARHIEFFDDIFTLDKKWLEDFLCAFSQLKIPFICNSRFDCLDENTIRLLSLSGCIQINAALECGNEHLRAKVLMRPISDEMIIETAKLIRKYNIRLVTHNMIGIPGETEKDILRTIELNRELKVDDLRLSIFNPYPGTDLRSLCDKDDLINTRYKTSSFWDYTVLRTKEINQNRVNYYFLAFRSLINEQSPPSLLKKTYWRILNLRRNSLYRGWRAVLGFAKWYYYYYEVIIRQKLCKSKHIGLPRPLAVIE